jgi:hypothetical protein
MSWGDGPLKYPWVRESAAGRTYLRTDVPWYVPGTVPIVRADYVLVMLCHNFVIVLPYVHV